jgi:S-disulfanyl-L-cysteine oxidoreductase SoxD
MGVEGLSMTRAVLLRLALVTTSAIGVAAGQAPVRSVLDGVYTSSQAERGREVYLVYCRSCHSEDLSGGSDGNDPAPALRTPDFAQNRRELGNLFTYVRRSMPRDAPGSLDPSRVADVVAYLLRENGFPSGTRDLPGDADQLRSVRIEPISR